MLRSLFHRFARSYHIWTSIFISQVDILTILSVDHEKEEVGDGSKTTLVKMLDHLAKDAKDPDKKVPPWVVEQAHAKIFEISQIVADSNYAESLFHEQKTLEKHLATLHGYLLLLNKIENSR